MKKSNVLRTPTRLSDLTFDDLYVDDFDTALRAERLNARKLRRFRNED